MLGIAISLCSTTITTVIAGYLLYLLKKINDEKDEMRRQQEESEKVRIENEEKQKELIIQAIVQLLRIQLCEYHDKYMEQGYIPTYAYDNWTRMFNQYHELGGNGMVTHMNDDIEKLNMTNHKDDE